jgi:hypothetical protein
MKTTIGQKSLLAFLKEILIVLIGVLLALFINDWKERRNNESYLRSVQSALKLDIEQSQAEVDTILRRHQAALDSMEVYLADETQSVGDILLRAGGIQYPAIKNISLRFLVANKAELVDYQLIALLTDIELISQLLEKKFDKLMDYGYEKIDATDQSSKIAFAAHLANVMDSEASLLELYANFLAQPANKE